MANEPPDHSIPPPVTRKYPRSTPEELPTLPEFTGSLTFTVGNKRARKTTTLQLGPVSRSTSPDPDPRFFPLPSYNSPICKENSFLVFTRTSQENGRLEVQPRSSIPTPQEYGLLDDVHQVSMPSTSASSNPHNYRRCPKELPMLPEYTGSLTFCLGSGRRSGGLRTPSSNMFTLEVPSTPLNSLHEDDTKLTSSNEDPKHNVDPKSAPPTPTSSDPIQSSLEAIRHDVLSLQSVLSTSMSTIPTCASHEAIRLDVLPLRFMPSTSSSPIPIHSSLHEDGKHNISPESVPSTSTQNNHLHTANDEDMPKKVSRRWVEKPTRQWLRRIFVELGSRDITREEAVELAVQFEGSAKLYQILQLFRNWAQRAKRQSPKPDDSCAMTPTNVCQAFPISDTEDARPSIRCMKKVARTKPVTETSSDEEDTSSDTCTE